MLLKQDHH